MRKKSRARSKRVAFAPSLCCCEITIHELAGGGAADLVLLDDTCFEDKDRGHLACDSGGDDRIGINQ